MTDDSPIRRGRHFRIVETTTIHDADSIRATGYLAASDGRTVAIREYVLRCNRCNITICGGPADHPTTMAAMIEVLRLNDRLPHDCRASAAGSDEKLYLGRP